MLLAVVICNKPAKWLTDFDQAFYLTIAYDLDRHGTFSNGVFDNVNSTIAAPAAGMFFAPVYPVLILGVMKIDPRFAEAVDCAVEAYQNRRNASQCEAYARPMHLLHAAFLAIGVLAIALGAELIVGSGLAFWLAGFLATAALALEAELFSFVMTESITFSLYSLAMLALLRALQAASALNFLLAGCLLGLLCLTRASFVPLGLLVPGLIVLHRLLQSPRPKQSVLRQCAAFSLGWILVISPWVARNVVSVGKWSVTEEYGSAALIERFAFNDMTLREYALAFPYCVPGLGASAVQHVFGAHVMDRFSYDTPASFFQVGRRHREEVVALHGRLDPVILAIARDEMRENWWRYLLVSLPLGWCGMWIGGILSLMLVPMFAAAALSAVRRSQHLFLIYAAPACLMLGLHAAVANHYTRYNLILLGPFCAGAAFLLARARAR
jgi:hypothetical protein